MKKKVYEKFCDAEIILYLCTRKSGMGCSSLVR